MKIPSSFTYKLLQTCELFSSTEHNIRYFEESVVMLLIIMVVQ